MQKDNQSYCCKCDECKYDDIEADEFPCCECIFSRGYDLFVKKEQTIENLVGTRNKPKKIAIKVTSEYESMRAQRALFDCDECSNLSICDALFGKREYTFLKPNPDRLKCKLGFKSHEDYRKEVDASIAEREAKEKADSYVIDDYIEKSCEFCRHENNNIYEYPCSACERIYHFRADKFEGKEETKPQKASVTILDDLSLDFLGSLKINEQKSKEKICANCKWATIAHGYFKDEYKHDPIIGKFGYFGHTYGWSYKAKEYCKCSYFPEIVDKESNDCCSKFEEK